MPMMSSLNIFGSLILLPLIVQLYKDLAYCSNDRPIFLFLWRWWKPMLCQWTSPSNSLVVPSTCNMHLHHADAASISFNFTPLCFYFCPLFRYFSGYYTTLKRTRSALAPLTKHCWFLFIGCSTSSKQLLTPQTFYGRMVLWCSNKSSLQHMPHTTSPSFYSEWLIGMYLPM